MNSLYTTGSVVIRNESAAAYMVAEMPGVSIPPGETIDLMDDGLAAFYDNYEAACRCACDCPDAKMCQDIQGGTLSIVEMSPPQLRTVLP